MNDGATGVIDAFELFDGVSLAFNNIPRGVATWNDVEPFELQIDWCLRGRFQLDGGIRLGEGDLGVHDERVRKRSMGFPAPLYAGLTIRISQSVGAESLSRSLPTIGLDFDALAHRLAGPSGCRIYTPDPSTRALLESFWDIDDPGTSDAAAPSKRSNSSPLPTQHLTLPHDQKTTSEEARSSPLNAAWGFLGRTSSRTSRWQMRRRRHAWACPLSRKSSRKRSGSHRWRTAVNAA